MFNAVLSNPSHPEYGVATIPFPIPTEQYDEIMGMMTALNIGNPVGRDCQVDEIKTNLWPVLKGIERTQVNIDELDYLSKRLDSFAVSEAAQFQATASKLGLHDMVELINLTFCCQKTTVVTNFTDLQSVGKDHYMNLNGGGAPISEIEKLDGEAFAKELIESNIGHVTPYGVLYENGMELTQHYDGKHLPAYLYESCVMCLEVTHPDAPQEPSFLYLPMTQMQIDRTLLRGGFGNDSEMNLRFMQNTLPEEADAALDIKQESIGDLNELCRTVHHFTQQDNKKLAAAIQHAQPTNAKELTNLVNSLELFDFVPGVRNVEEYGKHMIKESDHYEYDPNLEGYYDYAKYGSERMERGQGCFNDHGYISYQGEYSIEDVMLGEKYGRYQQMGGMSL